MKSNAPIILALDFPDIQSTLGMIEKTSQVISIYKLGLEFYLAQGKNGIAQIKRSFPDIDIFLDLKLHDIPHTVSGAAKAVASLSPKFLTVHASGGRSMVNAAVQAMPQTFITGVTILTSLSEEDVTEVGYKSSALISAVGLAKVAVAGGARAIVCSPLEIAAVRAAVGAQSIIITPGVRPKEMAGGDDQKRTMTPEDAIAAGANLVVIGRPITQSWSNGKDAMRERAAEIGSTLI